MTTESGKKRREKALWLRLQSWYPEQWKWIHVVAQLLVIVAIVGMISACFPKQTQVDTGLYPQYQDKDVRFRTTYYFRVFDYCADPDRSGAIKVPFEIDSLYRFRMTGKAKSLTNTVHFESGTLLASQIDPFGANIAYDEKNRQFYFKSQAQTKQEAEREANFKELNRLLDEYTKLKGQLKDRSEDGGLLGTFRQLIQQHITRMQGSEVVPFVVSLTSYKLTQSSLGQLKGKIPNDTWPRLDSMKDKDYETKEAFLQAITSALGSSPNESTQELLVEYAEKTSRPSQVNATQSGVTEGNKAFLSKTADQYCQQLRRGFQILGPEGWRTFDQDERLLLAMSSSGKPLISTLHELSGRVLDNQPIEAELLLPLLKEDLRITRTEAKLREFSESNAGSVLTILNAAIGELEKE